MVYEWDEAVRGAVEHVDRAVFDIVDPAVKSQPALLEREPHAGMRLEVGELRDYVLARLVDDLRGIRIAQPARDGRHVIETLAGCDCRHRAAVGVAADHDVSD